MPEEINQSEQTTKSSDRGRSIKLVVLTAFISVIAAPGVTALLVNIFERKQEGRNPFYRVVELTDDVEDPAV